MESTFNSNIANYECYVVSSQTGALSENTPAVAVLRKGARAGITTGVEIMNNNIRYYEVVRDNSLYLVPVGEVELRKGDTNRYYQLANTYLTDILANQKEIAYQISICALFLKYLEGKKDVARYRSQMLALYNRFEQRNEEIKLYCTNIQDGYILQLDDALKSANIGVVVSTGLVIVISCVVSVAFASLAWYTYYNEANESRKDARDIIKLNALLAGLDEGTRDEVYKIINDFGDENYKAGARKIKMQNLLSNAKNLLIFGGVGAIAYYYFFGYEKGGSR